MALIEVQDLVKTYKISQKDSGMLGYIKHLFHPKYREHTAVNHIDLDRKSVV